MSDEVATIASVHPSFIKGRTRSTRLDKIIDRLRDSEQFTEDQLKIVHDCVSTFLTHDTQTSLHPSLFTEGMQVGPYLLQSLLGSGGSAQVFKAIDADGEAVAIKLLHRLDSTNRFEREMQMIGTLAHPNIALAYETGTHENCPYIVMEFLPGPNLDYFVKQNGCMNGCDSGRVIRQAALGLAHAHDRGLVHRDVKPANLLWDSDDRVKVGDLGLADSINDIQVNGSDESFHTFEGQVAGTPDYMAPEQARSLIDATKQSDIFSLGATWQFLLTGKSRLPPGDFADKLHAAIHGDTAEDLPSNVLSPALERVYRRMVQVDLADRFDSMHQVVAAIDEAMIEDEQILFDHPADKDAMLNILVVDDDEVDQDIAIRTLQKINRSIDIRTAASLNQALEVLDNESEIDLVLLDLQLPDSFGLKTVDAIAQKHSTKTIIVLSGTEDPALAAACLDAGASEIVSKNDLDAQILERKLFIAQSRATRRSIS